MRRSAIASSVLHGAILLALIITLPQTITQNDADDGVSVDLVGPSGQSMQALTKGQVVAQSNLPVPHQGPVATKVPMNKPIEAPPPPPPPPPPSKAPPSTVQNSAAPPPPPLPNTASTLPTPPPPPQHSTAQQNDKDTVSKKPPSSIQSPTHQPHQVKEATALSSSVLNTLLKLKALQKQDKPPTHVYNPDAGGAPNGGGNPNSTSTTGLSASARAGIGNHVRPCWSVDAGAPGVSTFAVHLIVTTDQTGIVRMAVVDPQDQDKMSDPLFNAFAQRAMAAVQNYQCSDFSQFLPPNMLGSAQTFPFYFTP